MQTKSQHSTAMFFPKNSSLLRKKLVSMFAMTLGLLQTPAMAQCSLTGGTVSTPVTSACFLRSGSLTITALGSISPGANVPVGIFGNYNVTSVDNSGTISSGVSNAFYNSGGTLGSLTNAGQITTSSIYTTLVNTGTITNLTNNSTGTISSSGSSFAIHNKGGTIETFINSGQITSNSVAIDNKSTITNLTNNLNGTISSGSSNAILNNGGTIGTLTNSGQLTANGVVSTVSNYGTITNFLNSASGTIQNQNSRTIYNNYGATIANLNNAGIISAGSNGQSLINVGTINALVNSGTIAALDNQQGASSSALSYSGALPSTYRAVIASQTNYGQLSVTNPGQSLVNFNIYGNTGTSIVNGTVSVPASTLVAGTYRSVLTGLTSNNIASNTLSGTYPGGFNWQLVNTSGTTWDLVVTSTQATLVAAASSSNINVNGTSTLSTTGGSGSGAVSYILVSGPCTLSGSTLTGTGAGSCIVIATKAADSTFASATSSQITVSVVDISQIPSLSEWAMILMAGLMGIFAFMRLRKS